MMRLRVWMAASTVSAGIVLCAACGDSADDDAPAPATNTEAGVDTGSPPIDAGTADGSNIVDAADAGDASDAAIDVDAFVAPNTVVSLVSGSAMMCVLRADGKVKCWGDANFLGLGVPYPDNRGDDAGEMGSALPFLDFGAGVTAKALFGGSYSYTHCILTNADDLRCWGANGIGELGGDLADAAIPYRGDLPGEMGANMHTVDLGAGRKAVLLSTTNAHACAILDNGKVKCWGNNGEGELGILMDGARGDDAGEMGDNLPYADLGNGRTAKAIHVANARSCAITDENKVKCWGGGNNGQRGSGSTANVGGMGTTMGDTLPYVDLGAGRTVLAITGGLEFECAILDDHTVKCWGFNEFGQLGIGSTTNHGDGPNQMGANLPTVNLGAGRTAKAISSGGDHTCVILDNDQVKCWGRNGSGQLGYGDNVDRGTTALDMTNLGYVDLGAGRTAKAISAQTSATCALLDNGTVKCWGYNNRGNLGIGTNDNRGDEVSEMGDNLPAVDLGP